ncbi:MAG: hypothetical protein ACRDOK_21200 [Streptosporangiaceae bacterium]
MAGRAVALRALGADVRVCAPPDFADLLAGVGVPLVPAGQSVHEMVRQVFTGKTPSAADLAAGVVAAQFDAVAAAAEGSDVVVATGLIRAAAGARSVTEKLGIRDVVQTGAWIRPDERPLPAGLEAFLNAGTPPVYVGFGSMPLREAARARPRRPPGPARLR